MAVSGKNQIKLDDLLLGDVWFASGQSNMEMPMKGFPGSAVLKNGAEEIRAATHPDIRLLYVPKKTSSFPRAEFSDPIAWTVCTPQTAATFSAVAYFFGRDLTAAEHVPIGLIDSTWGGTPAEAWVSMDGLSSEASLMPAFAAFARTGDEQMAAEETQAADQREDQAARKAHLPVPKHPWHGDYSSWTPAWLYNAMVAPATGYAIKGVIWYQGESNTDRMRAPLYAKLFSALISDWRSHWHEGNIPFLYVQLANFEAGSSGSWPTVREAQLETLQLVNTGMAVIVDAGEANNIHPADKQTVGARLARAARAVAYGESVRYSGPLYRRISTEGSSIRVWFQGNEGDLTSKGQSSLPGFEVAGDDHHFAAAEARIEGSTVLVKSDNVMQPKYVRYGWQSAPVLDLYDSSGLPASPFTSERLPTAQ